MKINKIFCGLDTIHITITRQRNVVSFIGEDGEPTDKLFYGVLDILLGRNFVVVGGSKKFVNNGSEYIQSNSKEILIQLRSAHLMKFGSSKVEAILKFLGDSGVKPRAKRTRRKDAPNINLAVFYQITRLDFAVDYETKAELIKVLNKGIGYTSFFRGIPKGYFYRVIHHNQRNSDGTREHTLKEIKIFNNGFELAIYNKKLEIAEQATAEKLQLYPSIYREILSNKKRKLFRVELRLFRSRSVAFNNLPVSEIFALPAIELSKFGKATSIVRRQKGVEVNCPLFARIFDLENNCGTKEGKLNGTR